MQEHFIFSAVDNTFQELPPRKYLPGNTSGENAVTLQFKYSLTHHPSLPAIISLQELQAHLRTKGTLNHPSHFQEEPVCHWRQLPPQQEQQLPNGGMSIY